METMENLLDSPMLLAHGGTTIPLDVVEKPTMYEVKADLPGFVKSDVKIEVKDGYGEPNMGPMLILTAERKFEDEVSELSFFREAAKAASISTAGNSNDARRGVRVCVCGYGRTRGRRGRT
jgi:HSP20 family molecular chaperone IbpA